MIALDILIVILLLSWISALVLHVGGSLINILPAAAFVISIIRHIRNSGDDRRHPRHP